MMIRFLVILVLTLSLTGCDITTVEETMNDVSQQANKQLRKVVEATPTPTVTPKLPPFDSGDTVLIWFRPPGAKSFWIDNHLFYPDSGKSTVIYCCGVKTDCPEDISNNRITTYLVEAHEEGFIITCRKNSDRYHWHIRSK